MPQICFFGVVTAWWSQLVSATLPVATTGSSVSEKLLKQDLEETTKSCASLCVPELLIDIVAQWLRGEVEGGGRVGGGKKTLLSGASTV